MLNLFLLHLSQSCDTPRPWGLYFQDSATPQMEGLVELHDNIMFYLVIILFGVGWILISIIRNYINTKSLISHKYLNPDTLIGHIWTITPALILILIAFPSFKLLYLMDEVSDPAMSILAEGHQGYWSYQYPNLLNTVKEFIVLNSYYSDNNCFLENINILKNIDFSNLGSIFKNLFSTNIKDIILLLKDVDLEELKSTFYYEPLTHSMDLDDKSLTNHKDLINKFTEFLTNSMDSNNNSNPQSSSSQGTNLGAGVGTSQGTVAPRPRLSLREPSLFGFNNSNIIPSREYKFILKLPHVPHNPHVENAFFIKNYHFYHVKNPAGILSYLDANSLPDVSVEAKDYAYSIYKAMEHHGIVNIGIRSSPITLLDQNTQNWVEEFARTKYPRTYGNGQNIYINKELKEHILAFATR
jgi:hypothetical protein